MSAALALVLAIAAQQETGAAMPDPTPALCREAGETIENRLAISCASRR